MTDEQIVEAIAVYLMGAKPHPCGCCYRDEDGIEFPKWNPLKDEADCAAVLDRLAELGEQPDIYQRHEAWFGCANAIEDRHGIRVDGISAAGRRRAVCLCAHAVALARKAANDED